MMAGDRFISASAGTGKTHTISKAYVDIFEEAFRSGESIDVGNVLAITFTRKAAAEMKSRILGMINEKDRGNPIWQQLRSSMAFAWISTIDSFAQRILSEIGIYAEVDPDLRIGSGSMTNAILKRCMARAFLEHEELLKPLLGLDTIDNISKIVSRAVLGKRYSMMKSRSASVNEAGLALHSDPSQAEKLVQASNAFMQLFDEVYRSFSEEMEEESLTDFSGVLIKLRNILSSDEHAWIREKYSKQFRHIIVDEFQDTDSLQKEIFDLLRSDDNHVIYVGDAKQSIFRFRGAEVEVVSEARNEVESRSGTVEHLERNYRSHPDILKFCNAFYPQIFNSSEKPYCQTYELVKPLQMVGETGWGPRVKVLFDQDDEAEASAKYIGSIVGKEFDFLKREADGSKMVVTRRPIRYRDIAILLRKMKPDTGREYMKALSRHNIPYYTVGETGFFEMPEIAGVLAALKVLSNPSDEFALTFALMSPLVGLDINEMAALKYRAKMIGRSILEILGNLQDIDILPGKKERLERFHQVLDRYLPIRTLIRPSELAEHLVEDLDYPAFLAAEDSMGRKTANLRKFIIAAKRLDEAGLSLPDLVRMLNKVGLDDEEQASTESEETDAVKIMTVHKAKGLEFPIVVVGDTSWSQKDTAENLIFNKDDEGICFSLNCKDEDGSADTFLHKIEAEDQERDLEEEKRSLYVATTRASDMLILTFSGKKGKGSQPWKNMILGNTLEIDEVGAKSAAGFEQLIEIFTAPVGEITPTSAILQNPSLETRYIEPVISETYKEYISPTSISEASIRGWSYNLEDDETAGDVDRDRSQKLGLLAHQIMERIGNGCKLGALVDSVNMSQSQEGIEQAEIKEVWRHLSMLKDHPLVKEMENAIDSKNEFQIVRPFGKYILSGRPDKVIKTPEGWKILDFKFSGSEHHCEAYEFQTRFYLYIASRIFSPMLGAELFYLKDGVSIKVQLDNEAVSDFESELLRKIEDYQEKIITSVKQA